MFRLAMHSFIQLCRNHRAYFTLSLVCLTSIFVSFLFYKNEDMLRTRKVGLQVQTKRFVCPVMTETSSPRSIHS